MLLSVEKQGVNSKFGKNLIGAFYQPKFVLISDTSFLKSLKKEIICGYAEILKHAIIKNKKFFSIGLISIQNIF